MRVTDGETMNVVEMVLVGRVTRDVGLINHSGGQGTGCPGATGTSSAPKRCIWRQKPPDVLETHRPELIDDLGRVGPGEEHQRGHHHPAAAVFIPVIAPVGVGEDGQALNMMRILVAGAMAGALQAES